MQAFSWLTDDSRSGKETVVVIGNFDGVHLGHQIVARDASAEAHGAGREAVALTFHPHPRVVLGQGEPPPTLTTLERRAELLRAHGMGYVWVRAFDLDFAAWTAERFVKELLVERLRARTVVVGDNFHFGAGREGDRAMLERFGQACGFSTRVQPVEGDSDGPYSSSRVRRALARGDVVDAKRVLGRPHTIFGIVAHGDARGRTIGFPTANFSEIAEMLPKDGVYAARVFGGPLRAPAPAVVNIGVRPTATLGRVRTCEAHLLDQSVDLYDASLGLELVARLRDEKRFDGLDALKAQIARDVAAARRVLAT